MRTRTPQFDPDLLVKHEALLTRLQSLDSVIVAYSGGVDSSLLALYARLALGEKARIVIAVSPSLAQGELAAARAQARQFDFDLIEINTEEVELDEYKRNDGSRCFFCKSTLFEHLNVMRSKLAIDAIAYGANMDDLSDVRPGHQAAKNYGVLAPLMDCELYKTDIRALALAWDLTSHDRPQAACLSSRFPKNVAIDAAKLALVDQAEDLVRQQGFRQVRVRYRDHNEDSDTAGNAMLATVEVGSDELSNLDQASVQVAIMENLQNIGFTRVVIDSKGYRQGGADG